jgi:NADPH:quinone reductase-like Zn-dependent oxidoreductase
VTLYDIIIEQHSEFAIKNYMKAVVYTKYGTPDVLELKQVDKPIPKDNEVLIKVYSVSINDWDLGLLHGDLINRLINGLFKPKIKILGSDIAGRIEAAGKNVTKFQPGDEVYGDLSGTWGGFAEYVCASENALALKPAGMSFEEAAAIPQAAMLAVQGLIDKGNIQKGQKLLINGAGGGVGTFGVQVAKLSGIEVTGVDSPGKLDMMHSIGYDHVIDYTIEDFTKSGQCYDLILDVKTFHPISDYLRSLSPNGIYVSVGGSMLRLLQAFIVRQWLSMVSKKKICIVGLKPNKDLAYMNELFNAGKIRPVIDGHYKLDEVPKAMKLFGEGVHKGKVVITVEHGHAF